MTPLYYTFTTLARGKGSHVIKTISLTLGLAISMILFARIAFDKSFDSHYTDVDKLYALETIYHINNEKREPFPIVFGAVPPGIARHLTDVVEAATVVRVWTGREYSFFYDGIRWEPSMILTDTLYFQTMGLPLISGDARELANPEVIFVSESFARQLFGDESPIGKVMTYGKEISMTIKGMYEDIPENMSLRHDLIVSIPTLVKHEWGVVSWVRDDSYQGYVRLRSGVDLERANGRINALAHQHLPFEPEKGVAVEYQLRPIQDIYSSQEQVKRMNLLLFLLGFSLLFVAAMNYILISISSLYKRAKAVGIHKCNGATGRDIFGMFLQETAVLIGLSLLLVFFILINFRTGIEELIGASLYSLFNRKTVWVPVGVVMVLFLIAGVVPGRIFASIPVSQVFRRYTEAKSGWKRPLLFVEFAGVSFIFGLMCVIMLQYRQVMTKDLGHKPDNLASVYYEFSDAASGRDILRRLPMVEDVGITMINPTVGYAGSVVMNENAMQTSFIRWNGVDYNYISVAGIELVEGRNVGANDEILVNEEFVRSMGWTDSPIGKVVHGQNRTYGTVVGVMKDFYFNNLYGPILPLVFTANNDSHGQYTVKLKEPFEDNLRALNREMAEIFPHNDITFKSLRKDLDNKYMSVRRFRDSVIIASLSIFLIALMGLFGYINEEVRRRSKEIAIRKVNGAETRDILALLSRNMFWIALVSVSLGTVSSWYIGNRWLDQFAVKIDNTVFLYIGLIFLLNALIHLGVIFKSWKVANENPVDSIKNE